MLASSRRASYAGVAISVALILPPYVQSQMILPDTAIEVHGEVKTIRGAIIDPRAYLQDGRRAEPAPGSDPACVTLILIEDITGAVYLFLIPEEKTEVNEIVPHYAGHRVTVTGRVYLRGGLRGILPTSVEPLDTDTPPTQVLPSTPIPQQDVVD